MKKYLPIIFTLLLIFSFVTNQTITITITDQSDPISPKIIGPNGTIALTTDRDNLTSIFNRSDIENKTQFLGYFMDAHRELFRWNCRLWDPEDMNVTVLCKIDEQIYRAALKDFMFFFSNFTIDHYVIEIDGYDHYFDIDLKEFNIPFIYSDSHYIDLDSDKDSFELIFKSDSYLGEDLVLVDKNQLEAMTDFDSLSLSENELVLYLSRKKIEEVLTETKTLSLTFLSPELGPFFFPFAGEIRVNYTKPKEYKALVVTKVLNDKSEKYSFVALETNITEIAPLTTSKFNMTIHSVKGGRNIECFFKKYDDDMALLLMCENTDIDYKFDFQQLFLELNNISYKYNFFISQSNLYQRIYIKGEAKKIYFNYPLALDFTAKDIYTLEYFMDGPENFYGIKFFEDAPELECTNYKHKKICLVPKSHFYGHQAGFYHTLYLSNNQSLAVAYDARPINVSIEPNVYIKVKLEDNIGPLIVGQRMRDEKTGEYINPTMALVTNYDDLEDNIFNTSDIENIHFSMDFLNENSSDTFLGDCRLWKPENEKIRLFCNFENLYELVTFNTSFFKYNDYTVIIDTEDLFKIEIVQGPIPFLYSDKQFIYLNEEQELYSLKFKCDMFINRLYFIRR